MTRVRVLRPDTHRSSVISKEANELGVLSLEMLLPRLSYKCVVDGDDVDSLDTWKLSVRTCRCQNSS